MVSESGIIKEILELVDAMPLENVNISSILEKHSVGLNFNEQRVLRNTLSAALSLLKTNGDITYNQANLNINASSGGKWGSNSGLIKSTLKRKEKLEQIGRENNPPHLSIGDVKNSTIIQGSVLDDSAITHKVKITPKINDAPHKWYTSIVVKYFIFPLIFGLILAYLVYRFGWN
jgi:hypothetical protein